MDQEVAQSPSDESFIKSVANALNKLCAGLRYSCSGVSHTGINFLADGYNPQSGKMEKMSFHIPSRCFQFVKLVATEAE